MVYNHIKHMEYLQQVLAGIVSVPEEIKINSITDERGVLLSVSVDQSDFGKIIGREGETAKAIRRIISAYGYLRNQKISVKFLEE